jgi:phage gpG-like protein
MKKFNDTPDFEAMWRQTKRDIVNIAAVEGLHFFQDSFDNQGFTDVVLEPWKQKKQADGYKILLQTGFLKNSLQVFDKNEKRIVFGSDAEYAEIHNEGGTIQITNTARANVFFGLCIKQPAKCSGNIWR